MKLEFDRMANGGYVIDLKANSDFNLHLERMSNEEDVYIYVRGSSEGEYKFYKKVFGKVVDMDFDIPEAITPKYYRIKTSVAPTLCEVTGDVENVTGQEVKPEGGSAREMVYLNYDRISDSALKEKCKKFANIFAGEMDGLVKKISWGEYWDAEVQYKSGFSNYSYSILGLGLDLAQLVYVYTTGGKYEWRTIGDELRGLCEMWEISFDDVVSEAGLTEEEFFSL